MNDLKEWRKYDDLITESLWLIDSRDKSGAHNNVLHGNFIPQIPKMINKVYNCDVLDILKKLPNESVDLLYIDPDYNVGIDYRGTKYKLKWDAYIDWYGKIVTESMRVMKSKGNLFTINYPRQNSYLRVRYLDKLAYRVNEYVWIYNANIGHSPYAFTTAHRSILHATKCKNNNFYKKAVAMPYQNLKDKRIINLIKRGNLGRMPYSWFYFNMVKNVSREKTFHPCQIPIDLVKMIYNVSTKIGDTIFILFGGSGSEILLAKELQRNYISCEVNEEYYKNILARLR